MNGLSSLVLYFYFSCVRGNNLLQNPVNVEYQSISLCITNICKREKLWRPTVVLKRSQRIDFDIDMIKNLNNNSLPYVFVDSENTTKYLNVEYLFIYYYEDCKDAMNFNYKIIEAKKRYLFIVEQHLIETCQLNLPRIGKIFGRFDVTFLIRRSNENCSITTFVPSYNSSTCTIDVGRPKQINQCINGNLKENIIFPLKTPTNMNQCPLKVGMGSFYPFTVIKNKDSLKTYDRLYNVTGLDVEIIKIVSEYFNATLDLYYILKLEENPYIPTDFLPFLINGSLEICAGGLYRIYGTVVDYSGVYARQAVIWVYTVDRKKKTWQNLMKTVDGLYLFMIFYVIYSTVWYFICKFDKRAVSLANTFIRGWGALVGTSSPPKAISTKQKVLNILYMFMCIHLTAYMNIQLYSFLTIQEPPQLFGTYDEIAASIKSGRTVFLNPITKYFSKDENYLRIANSSTDCDGFVDCAGKSFAHKGITILLNGYFYTFQAQTTFDDEAKVLAVPENLLTVYYEMSIRKQSPLLVKFKKVMERLFQAGIPNRLFKETIGITVVDKANIAASNIMSNSYHCQAGCRLSMTQFSGAFYVWALGCCLSFGVFVVEVIFKKEIKKTF